MEGIHKSNYLHSRLAFIGNAIGLNIVCDGWRYNGRLCFSQIFSIYCVVAYFYNLWKYSSDFNFICYSTVLSPLAMGKEGKIVSFKYFNLRDFSKVPYFVRFFGHLETN